MGELEIRTDTCTACPAGVLYARQIGKAQPVMLDKEPMARAFAPALSYVIEDGLARRATADDAGPFYAPHLADCPNFDMLAGRGRR